MERKYSGLLLQQIAERQAIQSLNGIDILVKKIPDCDIAGAMDPRLYKDTKKMALMMKFLPKILGPMDFSSPKTLRILRNMFNKVKSIPIVKKKIAITTHYVTASDGYQIPIRKYHSETLKQKAPILYFIHGGGFFGGSPDVVDEAIKLIVEHTDILAFSIDYRLAPEHPYPTGHEDCYAGLKWIYAHALEHGGDPQNIFVAGDSAGGNLTQYCTNKDLDNDLHMVKGQLLLYPTVNMGGVEDEYSTWTKEKYEIYSKHQTAINMSLDMFNGASNALGQFLGTKEVLNKYLTPYLEVNPNMPPTFITVGEHDFLKVETLAYARKLVAAGVETTTILYKGLGHAYIDYIGVYPQSEDCAIEMGQFILNHTT